MYEYKAQVVKVYDGDTITVDVDLGFKTCIKGEKIRLLRINAPEVRGEEKESGKLSRDFLKNLLLDQEIMLRTTKDKKGKYGRYLGEVFFNGSNVNDLMVEKGFAKYQDY